MSKLTRVFQKQFGVNAGNSDVGVFGSLAAASPQYSKDPETIQSLNAFLTGWAAETIANNRPALEDFNAIDFLTFYQLCYLLQTGVAEWNAETTYYIGSIVNDGTGVLYKSLANDNLNNAVTDATKWALVNPDSVTAITGEIRIWAGTIATIPSGWLFCDGSAVSQATYANLYAVIGHQYAADPGSGNFRLPDLRNYYLVGANADGAGIASVTSALSTANKTDSSGTTIASKTRRNNNWITPSSTQPQDGSGSRVARQEMAFNGVAMGQTGGAVTALPDFVAVTYIIKY